MKDTQNKPQSETLRQKAEELLKKKSEGKILELIEELAFQNEEKEKRVAELIIANKVHKRVEDELRISEERYRLLAENTRDVVYKIGRAHV